MSCKNDHLGVDCRFLKQKRALPDGMPFAYGCE